jgi:hypothetical protein
MYTVKKSIFPKVGSRVASFLFLFFIFESEFITRCSNTVRGILASKEKFVGEDRVPGIPESSHPRASLGELRYGMVEGEGEEPNMWAQIQRESCCM